MPQAPRVPKAEWEAHKALITDLYINQNKTLDEVIEYMATLEFCPSRPQWIRKINSSWKLRKNSTKEDWQHAGSLLSKRKENGKDIDLVMNGKVVPIKKRMKELKRYSALHSDQISQDSDQFHAVVVSTPPASYRRDVSYLDLPSSHVHDAIRSYTHTSNKRKVHTNVSSHVPLQQQHQKSSLDRTGPFITSTLETSVTSSVPEAVSRTIETVEEMFPVSYAHQSNVQPQEPVWIKTFRALILISANNLWDNIRTSFRCLNHFMDLVLSKNHLEYLEALLVEAKKTNGKLATHLLFSTIRFDSTESLRLMRFLLRHGVNPDSTDPKPSFSLRWWTALHEAVYWDSQWSLKLLVEFGADPHPNSEATLFKKPLKIPPEHLHDCSITELPKGPDECDTFNDYGHCHEIPPLFQAIRNGSIPSAQTILNQGVDPNYFHPLLLTALHCAIDMNDLGMVKILINAGALPDIRLRGELDTRLPRVKSKGQEGKTLFTPLQAAVRSKSLPIVEYLLYSGARPEMAREIQKRRNHKRYYTESGENCLQIAASTGNYEMMCLLLTSEADPNFRHEDSPTALQIVCGSASMSPLERYHAVSLLLRHGADINASPVAQGGRTALQAAVELDDYCLTELLLCEGADPNTPATKHGGVTAMEAAIKSGSNALKELLLRNDTAEAPLISWQDPKRQRRSLELAVSSGNLTLLTSIFMIGDGGNFSFLVEDIKVAIKAAIVGGSLYMVGRLLTMYPQVSRLWVLCESIWQRNHEILVWILSWLPPQILSQSPYTQLSPLWIAIHKRDGDAVRRLLLAAANPNLKSRHICRPELSDASDCFGSRQWKLELPIAQAISPGHGPWEEDTDMVELLVLHGAQINCPMDERSTPLLLALKEGKYKIAELLVTKGADTEATDAKTCQTPIIYASLAANYSLVKSLIKHGANLKESCVWGSPIQALTHHGVDDAPDAVQSLVRTCRLLLDSGADINADPTEYCKMTALQIAINYGKQELVGTFLEEGANIHAPAFWDGGRTALQAAASTGNFKLVKRLVEMGADVNAPPAEVGGATALQYAAYSGHINMAIFLLEHGAAINAPGSLSKGLAALQGASKYGRLDMIHLLLENDQEPDTVEERCRDSAGIAEEEGFMEIVELLRGYKRP